MIRKFSIATYVLLLGSLLAVSFDSAGASSTQTEKPRAELVMLDEKGCYWCEQWTHDIGGIYAKTTEGKRAPLRRIDIHERLPADLSFLVKGNYTPTFVLVSEGREVGRLRGYPGPDFFWPLLGQLLAKLPGASDAETTTRN